MMNEQDRLDIKNLSDQVISLASSVGTLETGFKQVVQVNADNQRQLGQLISSVSSLNDTVADQGKKLDAARTQKFPIVPVLTVMIAGAVFMLGLFAAVMAPINKDIGDNRQLAVKLVEMLVEEIRSGAANDARVDAELRHAYKDIEALEEQVDYIRGNRFTGDDGDALDRRTRYLEESRMEGK